MKNLLPSKNIFQFIKFSLVGMVNTAMDFGIFTFLNFLFGKEFYRVAQTVSYSCAVLNSYYLNKSWTFQVGRRFNLIEMIKFLTINLLSLGISLYFLTLFHEKYHFEILWSKVGATFFSIMMNFIGNKFWVFKTSRTAEIKNKL